MSLTFTHACLFHCCSTVTPPPEWTELSKETQQCWSRQVRPLLLCRYCTESSSVITGGYWGCQWRPGGSTLVGCPPAGCCLSPSDGLWWTGSFWSLLSRHHASPNWTQSSLPGPAGAAGSSPWDSDVRIILDYGCKCEKMKNAFYLLFKDILPDFVTVPSNPKISTKLTVALCQSQCSHKRSLWSKSGRDFCFTHAVGGVGRL